VPATAERPATPTEAPQWQLHRPTENVAISHWPKIPNFTFADSGMLPAPDVSESMWRDGELLSLPENFDRSKRRARGTAPLPQEAPWPRESLIPAGVSTVALPIPSQSIFTIQERRHVNLRATVPLARRMHQAFALPAKGVDAIARLISVDPDQPQVR